MNPRGWAALAILALLCFAASKSRADEQTITLRHQRLGPVNCQVVRDFVAMVGPAKAEQMARESGQSDTRIAAARKCLQDSK